LVRALSFRQEAGYSLVEVLIAIMLLTVGILGTVALVDNANLRTSDTKGREGATSLARELVESSRTVPFNNITPADLQPALTTKPGLADSDGASGWQVSRRNFTYTITYTACTVDDGSDRLGTAASHDATYCPGNAVAPSAAGADRNPADFRRVVFRIAWHDTRGDQQIEQSALINSTYRGPTINAIDSDVEGTIFSGSSLGFDATLSSRADTVKWYVDGRLEGDAEGANTTWGWTWDLGTACTPTAVQDGNYFVSAAAYDRNGATGGPLARSVTLNRCPPAAPTAVVGGRNWGSVEISWAANPESDVTGYSVFRGAHLVCSTDSVGDTSCRDESAPASGPADYTVVAYDLGPSGRRGGEPSAVLTVLPACGTTACNTPPNEPDATFADGTLTISAPTPDDPDSGDGIDFYRVYRTTGGAPSGPGDRHDVVENSAGTVTWTESEPGAYSYWVTAVDSHYSESAPVEAAQ
jgi:Tfp pilus assembly protein PilV